MNSKTQELVAKLIHPDAAHVYSDEELDAIEELDPMLAYRLARTQFLIQNAAVSETSFNDDTPVDPTAVANAIDQARQVLAKDGGDIELVSIDNNRVRVRMKGACAGCPNSALDLRNVVEKIVKSRVPGVRSVMNDF